VLVGVGVPGVGCGLAAQNLTIVRYTHMDLIKYDVFPVEHTKNV
jgi:hypothetical protein